MLEGSVAAQDQAPLLRLLGGGALMGVANLVPGISGGTMLLASGVYPSFIEGVAEVSSLRFTRGGLRVLAVVGGAAAVAILLFAGLVKGWVIDHRWIMYSLFIGLTLGGVPVLRREMRSVTAATWGGGALGFGAMALLTWMQWHGQTQGAAHHVAALWMFAAGVVGAGAMVLPGVSGAYLLLVLGVYVPVLSGIEQFKRGLVRADFGAVSGALMDVGLPVGLGVVVGVAVVSRGIHWLLRRYPTGTHGGLMGLLVGAALGLWPFQEVVKPEAGDLLKGRLLRPEDVGSVGPEDWATVFFYPDLTQVCLALSCLVAGMVLTTLIARLGRTVEATCETQMR